MLLFIHWEPKWAPNHAGLCYDNAGSIINALCARQILEQASKSPQNPLLLLCIHPFMKSRAEPQLHPSAPGLFPAEWKVRQTQGISSGLAFFIVILFFCLSGAKSAEEPGGNLGMMSSKASETNPVSLSPVRE